MAYPSESIGIPPSGLTTPCLFGWPGREGAVTCCGADSGLARRSRRRLCAGLSGRREEEAEEGGGKSGCSHVVQSNHRDPPDNRKKQLCTDAVYFFGAGGYPAKSSLATLIAFCSRSSG